MSEEKLGFDVYREMKRLKKISNKDDSLTISSRFVKYLIQQTERVDRLVQQVNRLVNEDLNIEDSLFAFVNIHFKDLSEKWGNKPYSDKDHKNSIMLRETLKEVELIMEQNKRYREAIIEALHGLKTLPSVAPRLYLISILDKALEESE